MYKQKQTERHAMKKVDMLEQYKTLDSLRPLYDRMFGHWEENLKSLGVKEPGGFGSVGSLQLILLYANMSTIIHKSHVQRFVNRYLPDAGDQQPRQLGPQQGYNVVRNNEDGIDVLGIELYNGCPTLKDVKISKGGRSGWIMLENFDQSHKGWAISQTKRNPAIAGKSWESKKAVYGHRCATCGAKEGEKSHIDNKTVTLDKGHMDPTKELSPENTIPQCMTCNGQYRDKAVFDVHGRVVACATTELVDKSSEDVQRQILEKLMAKYPELVCSSTDK
jgi:hypothetical protein